MKVNISSTMKPNTCSHSGISQEAAQRCRFHGVMVSTLDSESSDPSSNLGGTWAFFIDHSNLKLCFRQQFTIFGQFLRISRIFIYILSQG